MNVKWIRCCVMAVTLLGLSFVGLPAVYGQAWLAKPMDWPHWRGPEMNGISREKGLVDRWSPSGENLLWKREDLAGRSTPIVMNGKLCTIVRDQPGTPKEGEKVVCVDAATGKPIWENRFNVYLSDVPDTRVGWSSVVGDPTTGNVFALGVCDYFQCIDGETGKTLWSHSLSEEYGFLNTYGGRTNVPMVFEDVVIISGVVIGWGDMAKPAHRFIAFDKRNGQPVWFEGTRLLPYDTTYSSPVTTVIDGQAMLVFASGDGGVHAFQPRTGKRIWTYNVSGRGIDITPLIVGNMVICGHNQENLDSIKMGALFALDATKNGEITKTGELWRVQGWFVGKSSPISVDGRIYAAEDQGNLLIVDAKTGKLIGSMRLRGTMFSSPLYADGKIYVCTENGIWWTLKPTEKGVEALFQDRLGAGACYGSPIVSHGRLYVTTTKALYCIGQKDQQPSAEPRPEPPQETPVESDAQPAQLQVVPVESLLKPGQKQQFDVRLYNANGRYLRTATADAEFSITGPGSISTDGEYLTPGKHLHAPVTVTAKVGDLTGKARIRVVPELPWSFDFSDGEVPITWVGARYRHIALDFDVLTALNREDPRAAHLYIYLMTEIINSGRDTLTFDNSTPRQVWTALLRFVDLEGQITNLDEARKALDPSLEILKRENVLSDFQWAAPEEVGTRLTVHRGSRQVDGNGVMVKITTIPKGARSQGWMGQPDLHDYTIQADVLGAEEHGRTPDIGLIAQRYAINMMGAAQQVQIRSWPPVLRMAKSAPFPWKPNVWYTMKLQAVNQQGTVLVRGKVWPRDEKEPKEWTVEAVDESPNVTGSPGLYGNAINAEIFYDNIKVYPNAK